MHHIRKATNSDLLSIKRIARMYKSELGFVMDVKLKEAIRKSCLLVAVASGEIVGFAMYYARRDRWQTLHAIAVHPDYRNRGIGYQLFLEIPCPIRLKCTVDNHRANRFYSVIGMECVAVEDGRKRPLNVYELKRHETEFIMIHGGKPETPVFCKRAGWSYGVQFGYTVYDDCRMLDYVNGDWSAYLQALKDTGATQAVVADFRAKDEWEWVKKRMADVAEIGVTPIVVAKFLDSLAFIPETINGIRTRIGVSVPTSHMNDGFLPDVDEFKRWSSGRRDLHLLGGHPDQWLYLKEYYAMVATVASIDGNALYMQAREYGKMWSRYGYYHELRGKGRSTSAMTIASMKNAERYFYNGKWKTSKRIQACMQQLGLIPRQQLLIAV